MKKAIALLFACIAILSSCDSQHIQDTTYISNPFNTTETSAIVSTSETSISSSDSYEEKYKQYFESVMNLKRVTLTQTNSVENSVDNIFDYNGGSINMKFEPNFQNKSNQKPEYMTLGIVVMLNGVPQNISVNKGEKTDYYVQKFELNETKTGYPSASLDISFEPIIAEADKNEKALILSLAVTLNPHFAVDKEYPVGYGTLHSRYTSCNYLCNVKTPITNYSDIKIEDRFEKELITETVKSKYDNCISFNVKSAEAIVIDDNIKDSNIFLTEDGKAEVGIVFLPGKTGKYRIFFVLNGKNAKLTDGTDCIEVDAEEGYVYYLAPTEIENAGLYDSISAYPVKFGSEFEDAELTDNDFTDSFLPADEEGKAPF